MKCKCQMLGSDPIAYPIATPLPTPLPSLMIGRRRGLERVVNSLGRPVRRVNKSDDVLVDIDRLKQEVFVGRLGAVFAKDLFGAVETPYLESGVHKSAIRKKLIQAGHGMETIDPFFSFPVAAVVRTIL